MSARWLRVAIQPSRESTRDDLMAALFAAGSLGVHEDGVLLVTHVDPATDLGALQSAAHAVDADAVFDVSVLPDHDWTEAWRAGVRAHALGALTVAPPWLAGDYDPARSIIIEPAMAFGTGEHATTRGVVRLMQRVIRAGDTVADLGAGSAVLAIAAVKLGAATAAAIEMDPDAISNAEENVERNDVKGRVQVLAGDAAVLLPLVAPVRVVLANIISSVLTELLPTIAASLTVDGTAILSGILFDERASMLQVIESGGWRVVEEDREESWWSVTITR